MKPKIFLISFATTAWAKSKERLQKQYNQIQKQKHIFEDAMFFDENSEMMADYIKSFKPYLEMHGFALYTWKPFICLKVLENINPGDFVLYVDGGCSLPVDYVNKFEQCIQNGINSLNDKKLKFGCGCCRNLRNNISICRKEILKDFNLQNDKYFLYDYPHYESGVMLFKNSPDVVEFFNGWYRYILERFETSIKSDYYDTTGQHKEFLHNGGQSILQCMLYKLRQINDNRDCHYSFGGDCFRDLGMITRIRE